MTDETRKSPYHELARRFRAALISTQYGIGMDYALKTYVRNAKPSTYWLELAERVSREVADSVENDVHISGPPIKPTKLQ